MAKEYDFRGRLFYVDPSWQRTLQRLDIMERAHIWDAVMEYRLTGVVASLEGTVSPCAEGVYWMIIDTLSRYDDGARELSAMRSAAGKKGGGNPNFKRGRSNPYYINKDKQSLSEINKDKQDKQSLSEINKDKQDKQDKLPYHTIPYHTNINNNIDRESIEREGADVAETVLPRGRGVPPTEDMVAAYMQEYTEGKGMMFSRREAEKCFAYYEGNGWIVGRGNKMKDWRAVVRCWVLRGGDTGVAGRGVSAATPISDFWKDTKKY